MQVRIRDIMPEDIPQTTRLYHDTWLETYPNKELGITREDIDKSFADAYTDDAQKKRMERIRNLPENEKYLVAEFEGKIVGVCRAVRRGAHNQLQSIYVLPAYQGKGIGQKLWDEAEKFLDPTRYTIVHVATYNQPAINFYKKNGFIETGRLFNEERHRLPSGILIPETELTRKSDTPRHRAAGLIIKDGKILLMHRENDGVKYLVIPGGGIEIGETPEQAAIREISEETSVEARILKLAYRVIWDSSNISYFYLCEYISGTAAIRPDSVEAEKMKKGKQTYEPVWVDIDDMPKLKVYPLELRDQIIEDYKANFKEGVKEIHIEYATRRQA